MAKKPLEIDMIAGSQLRDTQGEMLSVEGADISELISGNGRLNDNHGKGFFNSIGRVTGAKKIMKSEDCDSDRHKYYWEKVKAPFIYVSGVLYDDDDHPNAKAAAAILRNIHKSDTPLKLKASVEGGVIARGISDTNLLARTKIHSVALTFTPANNATLVEPTSFEKTASWKQDKALIKSVMHLAKTDIPSFRHIARYASAEKIVDNFNKIRAIAQETGLKSQLPDYSVDELIRSTVMEKVSSNIIKINDLISTVAKSRVMDAGHPSFTPPKEARPSFKPNEGSALYIQSGKYNVDPEHSRDMLARIGKPPTAANLNNAINTTDIHETQHSKNTNIANQLKNQQGGPIDADQFSRHVIHNANLDPHERHFLEHFVPAYTGDYTIGDPDEVMSTVAESLSGRDALRGPALKALQEKLPEETKESMLARLKDIHGKLKNTYGQYEAGQRLDIPTHEEYTDKNFPDEELKDYKPRKLNKALTAGYGGASAPGARTGGSVLQAEKLDDGRGGMKYINCNECGKSEVYMKHQVKCRNCGQHYPFTSLYGIMTSK